MYNDLFSIGPVTIHGYGLMIGIGIVLAFIAGTYLAKKKGIDADELFNLTTISVIGGFACAKVLFCIVEWDSFVKNPLGTLGSSGFVVYGGIIGGILLCALYCKMKKLPFWKYFDTVLPAVAIAQGFGRIGCFLAGCCYGRETDSFVGIAFHNSKFAPNDVKLIPTQLFSSAGCFIMAAVLFAYSRKERKDARTGALYLIMYSIGRSVIEYFRNDYRGAIGILSTSQFISIFILIAGIILFVKPDILVKDVKEHVA
ncbi:MAG: prolipoprotein diacylglyceryl transferase [Lachnospiraceae bacterium]|jgi:prolipoprotein diacylglyceryl transferase|nr:prolipoprotein diacylglyceryl transferase [Lachnoclostridium sp.]MDD7521056.1 prolipoprotein diacylglyceryl transferase [Lachnoclostridium sp.]MDY2598648.1 prolipoprotein diacylglyceryl transferase [Lachnospiraceae bacterium]